MQKANPQSIIENVNPLLADFYPFYFNFRLGSAARR